MLGGLIAARVGEILTQQVFQTGLKWDQITWKHKHAKTKFETHWNGSAMKKYGSTSYQSTDRA